MKKIIFFILIFIIFIMNRVFASDYYPSICVYREQVNLYSNLSEYYAGMKYTIKNNEKFPLEIDACFDNKPSYKINNLKKWKHDERFPQVLIKPFRATGRIAFFIVCPFGYVIYDYINNDGEKPLKYSVTPLFFSELGYRNYVMPVKNTIIAPYYLYKDKKDNEEIDKEGRMFYSFDKPIIINPNETIDFIALEWKKHGFCLRIKNSLTGKHDNMCFSRNSNPPGQWHCTGKSSK